jgi:hypothetical protein
MRATTIGLKKRLVRAVSDGKRAVAWQRETG